MRCDVCNCDPCETPGFCDACRQHDHSQPHRMFRPRQPWQSLDVGSLWDALNDPDRLRPDRAAQSTYDAVLWSIIHRRKASVRRLSQLSDAQLKDLIAALINKQADPTIVAEIEAMLP